MKKFLCLICVTAICLAFNACSAEKSGTAQTGSAGSEESQTNAPDEVISEIISGIADKKPEKKAETTSATSVNRSEWINAYKEVLLNLDKEDIELYDQEPRFCLCYIDSDSVPELVISTGNFHAAGCFIFTFADGKAVNLGPFGGFGQTDYIEKGNVIIDGYGNNGYFVETYCKLDGGILDTLLEVEIDSREEDEKYTVDGKEITKAQYDTIVSEITAGSPQKSTAEYEKCFAITQESIDKNLK